MRLAPPGPAVYTLWKYSSEDELLSRRRWTKSQLTEFGLTIIDAEPTDAEWSSFGSAPLIPMASYVKQFTLNPSPVSGFQVEYSIKNPEREGKVEMYSLEAGAL